MKILVTGAAGFIGSHLAERLTSQKHQVIGLDNYSSYYSPDLKKKNAADAEKKGVKMFTCDLAKDPLDEIVENVDFVFHLAAQPGISNTTPFEDYVRNNIWATQNLLKAVEKVRSLQLFVNIATSSVYGKYATVEEDVPATPASYYGVTKLAAEQLALAYYRDKGLPVCSLRPFSVYGERERPEKLYPKLIKSLVEGTEFPLYEGSEHHRRSYTYVGDIVDGLVSTIEHADVCKGEIFNLGTDHVMTTGEGIAIVEKIIGKKANLKMTPKRAGDQQETAANIKKARKILGYKPKTKPEEGLKRQVEWYLKNYVKK